MRYDVYFENGGTFLDLIGTYKEEYAAKAMLFQRISYEINPPEDRNRRYCLTVEPIPEWEMVYNSNVEAHAKGWSYCIWNNDSEEILDCTYWLVQNGDEINPQEESRLYLI